MATRYAVANGNWSATTTWNGGTLPTAVDYVYANGYTVTVDQDITVGTISTEICPDTGTGGGQFYTPTSKTFICNVVAGTTRCITAYDGTTKKYNLTYTIIGDIYGGTSSDAYGVFLISSNSGTSTANITGNIYAGSGANGIFCGAPQTSRFLNIYCLGNIYSSLGFDGVTIGPSSYIKFATIIGNCISQGKAAISKADNLTFIGTAIASANSAAIIGTNTSPSTSTSSVNVSGTLINFNSKMAIIGFPDMYLSSLTTTVWTFYDENDTAKPLYTADAFDQPEIANVRKGTTYASGTLTGTLAVPPKASVLIGVPTDNGIGEYTLNDEAIEHILELQNPKKVLGSGIIAY